MLRRSDFIAATYALSFVFANFGIAIAARMPMMTTTIKSSISVKPFLLLDISSPEAVIGTERSWRSVPERRTPLLEATLPQAPTVPRSPVSHRSLRTNVLQLGLALPQTRDFGAFCKSFCNLQRSAI